MNKLVVQEIKYTVNFKNSKSVNVSEEWGIALMKLVNENDFVIINWDMYNKYEIINIKRASTKKTVVEEEDYPWDSEDQYIL